MLKLLLYHLQYCLHSTRVEDIVIRKEASLVPTPPLVNIFGDIFFLVLELLFNGAYLEHIR